jgi:TDG/mug DNA glycosylase family protein
VHTALTGTDAPNRLGLQDLALPETRFFLAPNPSGANAHFTRDDQVGWYDELAGCLGY